MKNIDIEERVAKAQRLFKEEGYNCCQAVVLAYNDLFGIDDDTAASMSSGFGGGMGRADCSGKRSVNKGGPHKELCTCPGDGRQLQGNQRIHHMQGTSRADSHRQRKCLRQRVSRAI